MSETISPDSTLGKLRAEVRHDTVLIGGIFAYFLTLQEACEWVATFPKAIWAHIEVRRG